MTLCDERNVAQNYTVEINVPQITRQPGVKVTDTSTHNHQKQKVIYVY